MKKNRGYMTISISFTAALKIANSFFNQSERQKFTFLKQKLEVKGSQFGHKFFQIGEML